jgi:hypothetical protein
MYFNDTFHTQLGTAWPDVAADLLQVAPDQGYAIYTDDQWVARQYSEGSRVRGVALARAVQGPALEELAAAARQNARSVGWRQVHRDDEAQRDVFRRTTRAVIGPGTQFLGIGPVQIQYPASECPALRIDIETGCTRSRALQQFGDSMIHKLVRNNWNLSGPERWLRSEVLYDLNDVTDRQVLRDAIELPALAALPELLARHGLKHVDASGRWLRRDRYTKGELVVAAVCNESKACIQIELDRSSRVR